VLPVGQKTLQNKHQSFCLSYDTSLRESNAVVDALHFVFLLSITKHYKAHSHSQNTHFRQYKSKINLRDDTFGSK
jgi:hypothetical protein